LPGRAEQSARRPRPSGVTDSATHTQTQTQSHWGPCPRYSHRRFHHCPLPPLPIVLQLLEALLCTATHNLRPFLKLDGGVKHLARCLRAIDTLAHSLEPDAATLWLVDRACGILGGQLLCRVHDASMTCPPCIAIGILSHLALHQPEVERDSPKAKPSRKR